MKQRTKSMLRGIAAHFGLQIKYVSFFQSNIHGLLLPRERRILINANKPRTEHMFTVLHEIGHYVLHYLNPHRRHYAVIFDANINNDFLSALFAKVRRHSRYIFNRSSGKEWEADVWAMGAFFVLARHTGCRDDLVTFLKAHPEKTHMVFLVVAGIYLARLKNGYQNVSRLLRKPFVTA